jgi:hypothetical protein
MKIKKNSIKNLSSEFEIFKVLLDDCNFNNEFIVISFEYEGKLDLNAMAINQIYPNHYKIIENEMIDSLLLEKAKREIYCGLNDIDDSKIRTQETNTRLEKFFWKKIESYIDTSKSKIYTPGGYGGFTLWCIFWIFIDEENEKGLLVNAGAWD